ncbi:unnamed protein product [Rangifer tarandus platyrhynchus]|uniref:Uncharacterized protein n=1 Tax=Rangifer tarandus platyrhynchus TaxID=3082113 RepID=A0ABN9A1F0_RANTA|nr:unnamed protein product [Rangifer tarandus platyrhynchus]
MSRACVIHGITKSKNLGLQTAALLFPKPQNTLAEPTFQPLTRTSFDGASNANVIRTCKPRWGRGEGFSEKRLRDCSRGFPQAETRTDAEEDAHAFRVPTAPHALRLPTPQSGTSSYQRAGTNHSPSGRGGVPGELTTASLSWVVPRRLSLPRAAHPGGPSALRGEDRGEPPQLTPAHPSRLTLTLGDWASPGSLVPCGMLVSETTCSSWASATFFYSATHRIALHPLDLRRQPCSHTPANTGPASTLPSSQSI